MVAATLACVPVCITHERVSRLEGAIFVSAYCAYFAYLLIGRT
jgi:cation:H+ antiporter